MLEKVSLKEINVLSNIALQNAGANAGHARAIADTITTAERDGSISHGLFRLPGYVSSLKNDKVDGNAEPKVEK